MNSLLNINVIFCEEYDPETNSYKNVFDNIKIGDVSIDSFEMVVLANRKVDVHFNILIFLCKMKADGDLDTAIALTSFNIPEKDYKTNTKYSTEVFVKPIDISMLKESGLYNVMVFAKEKKEDEEKENKLILDEYTLIVNTRLDVI